MITLQVLDDHLNDYLNCDTFSDFCFNGLQVEGKGQIRRVATAVTASLTTIKAAIKVGADALIVHHGVFWEGDDRRVVGPMRDKLKLLLDHELSLFAYHLPLDAHTVIGNNWVAATKLGLVRLAHFGTFGGVQIGVKGEIEPTPIADWIAKLENFYGQPARTALGGDSTVRSVAILSGGAHKNLLEAVADKCDCFITGTADEPNWHIAHEQGIHFVAMGHAATETVGPKALAEYLHVELGLETEFLHEPNPF